MIVFPCMVKNVSDYIKSLYVPQFVFKGTNIFSFEVITVLRHFVD